MPLPVRLAPAGSVLRESCGSIQAGLRHPDLRRHRPWSSRAADRRCHRRRQPAKPGCRRRRIDSHSDRVRAGQGTVADGERQCVRASRGERRVRPSGSIGSEGHGGRARARPFISQRRSRTVVRGRACQRHRGGGKRDGRVRTSVDCRRRIRRRRCRWRIVAAAATTATAARGEGQQCANGKNGLNSAPKNAVRARRLSQRTMHGSISPLV